MILRNTLTFCDDIVQLLFCWLHPIPRSGDLECLTFTQTTRAVIFWIKLWNLTKWENGQLRGTKRAKKLHRLKSQSIFCEASQQNNGANNFIFNSEFLIFSYEWLVPLITIFFSLLKPIAAQSLLVLSSNSTSPLSSLQSTPFKGLMVTRKSQSLVPLQFAGSE